MSSRSAPGVGVRGQPQGCLCGGTGVAHRPTHTERVAIDRIGLRDAGVPVAFDVVLESAETLPPIVNAGIPYPAGQLLEPAFAVGVKGAFVGVPNALGYDPCTELVAIDHVALRDAGLTVAFEVVLPRSGFPRRIVEKRAVSRASTARDSRRGRVGQDHAGGAAAPTVTPGPRTGGSDPGAADGEQRENHGPSAHARLARRHCRTLSVTAAASHSRVTREPQIAAGR